MALVLWPLSTVKFLKARKPNCMGYRRYQSFWLVSCASFVCSKGWFFTNKRILLKVKNNNKPHSFHQQEQADTVPRPWLALRPQNHPFYSFVSLIPFLPAVKPTSPLTPLQHTYTLSSYAPNDVGHFPCLMDSNAIRRPAGQVKPNLCSSTTIFPLRVRNNR